MKLPASPEQQGSHEKYWIQRHVYLCATPDGVVLLDLKRDKYLGLCGRELSALEQLIAGWPSPRSQVADDFKPLSEQEANELATTLAADGLLTRDPTAAKSQADSLVELSGTMFAIGQSVERGRAIRVSDVTNFLFAWGSAAWMLRARSFDCAVRWVAHRKQSRGATAAMDHRTIMELIDVFRRLRLFAFSAKGKCLFHALVLTTFLSRYGLFPSWVVGVKTSPWGAHSWVQQGNLILDSTPEEVRTYTPILVV